MTRQNETGGSMPADRPELADLHGHRVAVQLAVKGHDRLLVGTGVFDPHHPLGRVLRIQFPDDPEAEIIIEEAKWTGEIIRGPVADCDFLIRLGHDAS